jgi:hypothetical protein
MDSFYFEALSDALQELRIDIYDGMIEIYDRYITEKHFVHFGDFQL